MRLRKILIWVLGLVAVLAAIIAGLLATAKGQKLALALVIWLSLGAIHVASLFDELTPEQEIKKARREYITSLKGEVLEEYRAGCKQPAFIKLGNRVFAIARQDIQYLERDEKSLDAGCDMATPGAPLQADQMSLLVQGFKLPSGGPPFSVQFNLKPHPTRLRDTLAEALDKLHDERRSIEDLPKVGAFYEFVRREYRARGKYRAFKTSDYISADPGLVDANGRPIVLHSCLSAASVLRCGLIFDWRPDVRVSVRAIQTIKDELPKPPSIDAWREIFPLYRDTLNAKLTDIAPTGVPP